MDHKEIEQKDVVERYVLHQLSIEDENQFEEHLLYCGKCRRDLATMEQIIYGIQHEGRHEKRSDSKNKSLYLYRIAAAVVLISVAIFLINYILNNRETMSVLKTDYANAYIPSKTFENAIANIYRSENFKIIVPKKSEEFNQYQSIKFEWDSKVYDNLNLVVFNNKEELIFEKKIASPYVYINNLQPGLYYWQLETDDESIYIDKIFIR
jgi:hypothetical protein